MSLIRYPALAVLLCVNVGCDDSNRGPSGVAALADAIQFEFASDATPFDLDRAIGDRVEKKEMICGAHIRLQGKAEHVLSSPVIRGSGKGESEFLVYVHELHHWPADALGRVVIVEGRICRVWVPPYEPRIRKGPVNAIAQGPFGFRYIVDRIKWKQATDEESGPME